ncbi:MAG: hypothetical protein PHQ09_06730 [Actinomycetota bacterium]|nr:hypothetical protein [Actinomycetota bacterium]
MRTNKTLICTILLLLISFIFLWGCKSPFPEKTAEGKGEETIEELTEETTNKDESKNEIERIITESEYFKMPDEIILYNKGEHIIVKKNNETYNKITYITNERFKIEGEMIEEAIPDEFIENIKNNKFAIEFIYNSQMQTVYYEWRHEKNYTKILFPLPDFRAIFGPYQYEHQSGYQQEYQDGPLYVSIQPESDYLIAIIEKEFDR